MPIPYSMSFILYFVLFPFVIRMLTGHWKLMTTEVFFPLVVLVSFFVFLLMERFTFRSSIEKLLEWIGRNSYSIYLIHIPILVIMSHMPFVVRIAVLLVFSLILEIVGRRISRYVRASFTIE